MRELVVDGIPALLAPATGPMRAGLAFRVGWADEKLSQHGITHLVEHLALYPQGVTDYHFNGLTGPTVTQFVVQGSAERIVEFLHGVCAALADLPMQRLETEKEVLRTEAAGRFPGALDAMQLWRYGACGYGLASYPEWGTYRVDADEIREWVGRWFTRENAVLWIAGGQVPAGLSLTLPSGERQPLPAISSALPVTPAYFAGGPGGIGLDSWSARGTPAAAYAKVLERTLFQRLRQDAGISYTTATSYRPLNHERAVIAAFADVAPHREVEALRGFIETLRDLAGQPIGESDLVAVRTKAVEPLDQPDAAALRLPNSAANLLTGHPIRSVEQLRAEWQALTSEDLRPVATDALRNALVMTPSGTALEWAGFEQAPTRSRRTVIGPARRSRLDKRARLVIAPDGVSVLAPDGAATVRYADCAVVLAWPDGGRQLIGTDGIGVAVEPTVYRFPAAELTALDAAIPPDRMVPVPERDAAKIPRVSARTRVNGYRRGYARLARRARLFRHIAVPAIRDFLSHYRRPITTVAVLAGLLAFVLVTAARPGTRPVGLLVLWFLAIRGINLLIRYRRRRHR